MDNSRVRPGENHGYMSTLSGLELSTFFAKVRTNSRDRISTKNISVQKFTTQVPKIYINLIKLQ